MKISYNWLKELTGVNFSPEDMGDMLTLCGTACEYVDQADEYMNNVVVGEITAINAIEGADKIRLATVNLGDKSMDVVCGAPNVEVGQKVPVALEGAKLAGDIIIKKTKIRGIESSAMICSERELGLSDDHSGILVLETDALPGKAIADQLDFKDQIMTFELTPNRGDSMSAIGIARDLAALAKTSIKRPEFKINETSDKASDSIKVSIDDADACPRYAARIIKNVKIGQSPWWMKKKLILCGIRPISNIVDITNYVMLETGHPLHAFDLDRFGSNEVVVRRAKDKEKFKTLDGNEHELTPDVLMITNGKEGVAAGGVMGGFNSEVEDSTTNILLEAAHFNPKVIRVSRRELGMVSESSIRFEKGVDPNGVIFAIDRAAYLMQEICGGEVSQGVVDCYPNKIEQNKITLRPQRCNAIIGTDLSAERMIEILTGLEYIVEEKDSLIIVTVPTYRTDIDREIDLIEEVARIVGYENIPDAVTNIGPLYSPIHYQDQFNRELRTVLTSAGFNEMVQHGLVDGRQAVLLKPDVDPLKIVNPVSEELNVMRTTLLQTALNVVNHNVNRRVTDVAIFENGTVYFPPDKDGKWVEQQNLVLAVTGNSPHTWRDRPRPLDFYDLTGALDRLKEHFKWPELSYKAKQIEIFEDDISFEIYAGDSPIGIIGKFKAGTARKFDIKQTVYALEINLDYMITQSGALINYQPLPIYPAAPRDLALIVDESINAADLIAEVKKSGGKIVEKVDIFDLYQGKQIKAGKKSVAISINYRSLEGNLSSEQVEETQRKVVKNLKDRFNAEVRDK